MCLTLMILHSVYITSLKLELKLIWLFKMSITLEMVKSMSRIPSVENKYMLMKNRCASSCLSYFPKENSTFSGTKVRHSLDKCSFIQLYSLEEFKVDDDAKMTSGEIPMYQLLVSFMLPIILTNFSEKFQFFLSLWVFQRKDCNMLN